MLVNNWISHSALERKINEEKMQSFNSSFSPLTPPFLQRNNLSVKKIWVILMTETIKHVFQLRNKHLGSTSAQLHFPIPESTHLRLKKSHMQN